MSTSHFRKWDYDKKIVVSATQKGKTQSHVSGHVNAVHTYMMSINDVCMSVASTYKLEIGRCPRVCALYPLRHFNIFFSPAVLVFLAAVLVLIFVYISHFLS